MPTFLAKRTAYPYIYLHQANYYSLQEAMAKEEGRFFKLMAAMLFSAFTVEGYINFLGEIEFADWYKVERGLGRDGRLTKLFQKYRISPSMTRRPFKTYGEIFLFRDALAHSRVARMTTTGAVKRIGIRPPDPLSDWEKLVSLKTARKFFDDTNKIIVRLHKQAGFREEPFFSAWESQWEVYP